MGSTTHLESGQGFSEDFEIRQDALEALQKRIHEAPVDTREALSEFAPSVDEFQEKVVLSEAEVIRMVAPAGSGKTQTIVNRVVSRVKEGDRPSRMLILTFDNSAVASIREKLAATIDQLGAKANSLDEIEVSTLNSYGFRILRDRFPDEHKRIPKPGQHRGMLRRVLGDLKAESSERHRLLPFRVQQQFYLDFFSILKNELFDPRDYDPQSLADFIVGAPQADPFFEDTQSENEVRLIVQALMWLFKRLDDALRRGGWMDFDDQKLRAYRCLVEDPAELQRIQGGLTEVVVDEFQDINRLDFALVEMIARKSRLVVTGDDDQAIYGFRGCTPDFIINLETHLKRPVASFTLDINYRCPPNIVEHADRLIRHNSVRIQKNPRAYSTTPSDIKVVSSLSAGIESKSAVGAIRRVLERASTLDYSDFAVLYRTNAQSLPMQVEFILNDIPYYVRQQDNIANNEMLPRLLTVLEAKAALDQRRAPEPEATAEVVLSYFSWTNNEQRNAVRVLAEVEPLDSLIHSSGLFKVLPKAENSKLADAVRELRVARGLNATLLVLGDKFKGLRGMVGSLEDSMDQKLPLGEIGEVAAAFRGSIDDFVQTMRSALERAVTQNSGNREDDGVALLTYFRSKGRQWHTVLLTSCNDGLIPHRRSPVEDERRLFYVAMTRASANLYVSYVKSAVGSSVAPSRFLSEAGLL